MERGVPEDLGPLVKQNVCGTSRVIVGESTIQGANRGLFAKKELREGSIVCDYFGKNVAKRKRWSERTTMGNMYLRHE